MIFDIVATIECREATHIQPLLQTITGVHLVRGPQKRDSHFDSPAGVHAACLGSFLLQQGWLRGKDFTNLYDQIPKRILNCEREPTSLTAKSYTLELHFEHPPPPTGYPIDHAPDPRPQTNNDLSSEGCGD